MSNSIKIAIAQLNSLVGDIEGNTEKIIQWSLQAGSRGADLVLFPELAITGYPPEDLLLRRSMKVKVEQALGRISQEAGDIHVVVGYPRSGRKEGELYNAAGVFFGGELVAEYFKCRLPNYQVFDEMRYFTRGDQPCTFQLKGASIALSICEDVWNEEPMLKACRAGADIMLNLNASPYHSSKREQRLEVLGKRTCEGGMPVVYCNMVGGQDELVFDGGSLVVGRDGQCCFSASEFVESLDLVEYLPESGEVVPNPGHHPVLRETIESSIYEALVLGVRDYVDKNGFDGAVLGLSGGIDSAVTLAVAVDALGAERVQAVMMPFEYTSKMSLEDAEEEASVLGVDYSVIPIAPMYEAFMDSLEKEFEGMQKDATEENLQSRCRGVLLMALSNKKRYIVLTTGNKSEMAVGYATLYGDMAGGYCVLKDVSKSMVYRLASYRNTLQQENIIPQRVIDRPPSAELAPDQKDTDSLPDYDVLDRIIELYAEQDTSVADIISQGFDGDAVRKVARLIQLNEYKRRQAPVGPRVTARNFGKDRRYPITSGWKPY